MLRRRGARLHKSRNGSQGMIGVQACIICSACPGGNLPQNQKPSYRRYRRLKSPDDDVIIIHNVGERRAIYCAPNLRLIWWRHVVTRFLFHEMCYFDDSAHDQIRKITNQYFYRPFLNSIRRWVDVFLPPMPPTISAVRKSTPEPEAKLPPLSTIKKPR